MAYNCAVQVGALYRLEAVGDARNSSPKGSRMRYLVIVIVAMLVVVLATFGIQNPSVVDVRFLQFQSPTVPLYIVILLSALIGILVSSLLSVPGRIQRQRELRRLRQQVSEQAQQIADLKARLPAPVMKPLPGESPS